METQAKPASKEIPSESQLQQVFAQVVGAWAQLEPQKIHQHFKTPPGGAIERKVVFSGPVSFHLVVRTTHEFGLIMGRLFAPGVDVNVDPEDAFAELVNMYCGHLKNLVWGKDASYSSHLPEKSDPRQWPSDKPDVACFLRVGAFPVEILLWELPA